MFLREAEHRAAHWHIRPLQRHCFGRQNARQRGIDERRRLKEIARVRGLVQTSQALPHSDSRHQREYRSIGIRDSDDVEARPFERRAKTACRVTANLAAQNRVVAPQHVQSGDIDDERPSRLEEPVHLGDRQSFSFVRQAVEHVKGRHNVKKTALEGDGRDGCLRHVETALAPREFETASRQIETSGLAKFPEDAKIGARATAAVEQPGMREARGRSLEEWAHETPEPAVPEMILLNMGRDLEQSIHADDSTRPVFPNKTHNVALTACCSAWYSGHEVS